jgi:hypothetical protein
MHEAHAHVRAQGNGKAVDSPQLVRRSAGTSRNFTQPRAVGSRCLCSSSLFTPCREQEPVAPAPRGAGRCSGAPPPQPPMCVMQAVGRRS